MNISWYIAKRMLKHKNGSHRFAIPVLRLATWSIALGVAVMILSVAIVTGFQSEIRDKVIGFGSHIQITAFNANPSLETDPVRIAQDFYPSLNEEEGVKNIQVYALKPAMLQSQKKNSNGDWDREIQGVVTKGVSGDYNWDFIQQHLTAGKILTLQPDQMSNEIVLSKTLANRLGIALNDTVSAYFINNNAPRERKFSVCGIYHSGMDEFDKQMVFIDLKHLRVLNGWGIEAMCYIRNDVYDGKLIIEANAKGSGPFLYDFGKGFSEQSSLLIRPGKDTLIRVIVSSSGDQDAGAMFPADHQNWAPDTAWLEISYYPKIVTGMEYELQSNPETESAGDTHFVYHHPGINVIAKMRNSGGSRKYYAGGFEVLLNSWDDLEKADQFIYHHIGPEFRTQTIRELHQDLFQWLSYLDMNIWVILTLMLLVSLINMCSTLLVLILERTNMIGILKSLGADNSMLRNTFLINGIVLTLKGLLYGNILALTIAFVQMKTGWLSLDQSTYFIETVPVQLEWLPLLLINLGTLFICLLTLLIPTHLVSRISPIKAIRFD